MSVQRWRNVRVRKLLRYFSGALVALSCVALLPATSGAKPADRSRILSVRPLGGRQFELVVHSAAMNRPVTVWLSHPNRPAPTLYLLNAVDGGESGDSWTGRTDVANFFADKHMNVVVPIGGRGGYYTDWLQDDPALGRYRWASFLTRELPPLLHNAFHTTSRNAIAGLSMSATSALDLAIHNPGLYQAVGAYSGCTRTSDAFAQALIYTQLLIFGGNAGNMWGAPGNPAWADHDPFLHADRLRGVRLYVSAGSGLPGRHETLQSPGINGNVFSLIDRIGVGGAMEAVAASCTRPFVDRLAALGIPVTADLSPARTHAWNYWQDDLHNSWPMFAAATGA